MSNNSIISQSEKSEDEKSKSPIKWRHSVWQSIAGLIWLVSAINSLQGLTEDFADDIYKLTFIENWMAWIAVAFFALGWFLTHWVEIELSKNRVRLARLLIVIIVVGAFSISMYFKFLSRNEVLQHFELETFLLIMSGYSLRYAIFRDENLLPLQKAFWSKSA
jgi:cation transport ATPase